MKNTKKIRILHIASFSGNIGDFANHQGFYKKLKKQISADITQLEIRKFYKNRQEMEFNNDFIKLVNNYDLLILGGGGFFDLKWDYSLTGTTINFTKQAINKIKIPVLINAMGYHEYGIVKRKNIKKFKVFLETISNNKNWLISVRNDGSLERINKRYKKHSKTVFEVPDNGFYFIPAKHKRMFLEESKTTWLGFNITNELFNLSFNKNLELKQFNSIMGKYIDKLLSDNIKIKIILFPHTYQDISTISLLLNEIKDKYKRERVVVAPLLIGQKSIEQVFDLYRICSCVVGMRFHTNVCCIAMNIPTIGLAGHEQILSLYKKLGISNRCVKVEGVNFTKELQKKLKNSLKNTVQIKSKYRQINLQLKKKGNEYFKKIKIFLEKT